MSLARNDVVIWQLVASIKQPDKLEVEGLFERALTEVFREKGCGGAARSPWRRETHTADVSSCEKYTKIIEEKLHFEVGFWRFL